MKKFLACFLAIICITAIMQGCSGSNDETKPGTMQSGKIDLTEFTITYEGTEYNIFTKMGSQEETLKGDFIGCAAPNGEVQAGVKGNPEEGTYNVYECLGDETSYMMLGLDYSTLLVYEYGNSENDTYYYWMSPPGFGESEDGDSDKSFEEQVSDAIANDDFVEVE